MKTCKHMHLQELFWKELIPNLVWLIVISLPTHVWHTCLHLLTSNSLIKIFQDDKQNKQNKQRTEDGLAWARNRKHEISISQQQAVATNYLITFSLVATALLITDPSENHFMVIMVIIVKLCELEWQIDVFYICKLLINKALRSPSGR